jgi:electron transport complex protein RnfC
MALKACFCGVSLPPDSFSNSAIEQAPLPQKVILPLGHDADNLCTPVVTVGELVKTGQLLGQSTGLLTPPVHSSVSGRVADIRPWTDQQGNEVLSIIVESDGEDSWQEELSSDDRFLEKESEQLLENLRDSGIVESGPPAAPLHAKFGTVEPTKEFLFLVGTPRAKPVDTVIINGIDAEPGMAAKRATLRQQESDVTAGIKIIQKLLNTAKVVLAVGARDPLSSSFSSSLTEIGVQLVQGKDKYPLGLNPILVKWLTGKEIPLPHGSDLDLGVVVVDVLSLVHLVEAVRDLKPQVEKVVSVSGAGVAPIRNLRVRLGTPISDVLEQITASTTEPTKVIVGGAMTGYALFTSDLPVTKETNALIFQTADEAISFSPDACINCGTCVHHCPARLLPNQLAKYCEFGMFEEAEAGFLLHCIECGICAYVCPEKRPMLHLMRFGKRELSLS